MRSFVAALLILVFMVTAATADPVSGDFYGIWQHEFTEYTAYVDLGPNSLIVWTIDESGNCSAYPSAISWDGNVVDRHTDDWYLSLTEVGDMNLRVAPDAEPVLYEPAIIAPAVRCGFADGQQI